MKILITICARGGSKGVPKKNILPVNEVPLIGYTISTARKFAKLYDCDITLSTDDKEIKSVAADFSLVADYIRPMDLATDKAGKIEVIKDVFKYEEKFRNIKYDYILDLDITSPLRSIDDLVEGLKIIEADPDCINLFSVNPAKRNPYFNMVEQNEKGYYSVIKKREGGFLTRQSAPKVFDMNASFYFYKRKFFELDLKSSVTDRSLVYVMNHICFDLDELDDYEYMSYLIQRGKLDFEL